MILHGAGHGDEPGHGIDDFLLRVHQKAYFQLVFQKSRKKMIIGLAHARHPDGAGSQFSGKHAGHDVHFIGIRHRKNKLRLVYLRLAQHLRACTEALQSLYVQRFLNVVKLLFILIDDNDLPMFLGKPSRGMKTYFPRTDDDDPPGGRPGGSFEKHDCSRWR